MMGLAGEEEYVLLADRQTAEAAALPAGAQLAVAKTSSAVVAAASANGSRRLRDLLAMRRLTAEARLDVLFFPAVYSYFPVPRGLPCAVTFHDVIAETLPREALGSWRARLLWTLKCRLAMRRATAVLTVSEASRKGLARQYGLPAERIEVIGEAPSAVFRDVRAAGELDLNRLRRHGLDPGSPFVLYVGGISPHKNLGMLIRAFADVRAKLRRDELRLVLVGDHAGDAFRTCYHELCGLVAREGLGDAVHFTGFVPDKDLVHLYAACEAFVLPSRLEGFGLPAVEAMACGAAVLASNRGSLPEVLDGAGLLFDPDTPAAIARALAEALTDANRRQTLRQSGLKRAAAFSWRRSAQSVRSVLRQAVRAGAEPSTDILGV